jgi:dihydrolipoamide dehydrogenase
MNQKTCDVLVIGGGPGGYTAAIRAAQKGLRTILVEQGPMGGTCLNRGCIPTKSFLEASLMMASVRTCDFMKGDMRVSFRRVKERKRRLVETSRAGITAVLAESGIEVIQARACFTAPMTVSVNQAEEIQASHIVIATGAIAEYGPDLQVDGHLVWSTEHALDPESPPRSIAVVGAGNRGVEFANMYHNFGSRVTLIEKEKRILPCFHWELSDRYRNIIVNRKIRVLTRTRVLTTRPSETGGVVLTLEGPKGREDIQVERVLLTGERRPCYEGLDLKTAGLSVGTGPVLHGTGMETSVRGIYVVGDAAGPPYLAHKAMAQALRAVDRMLGNPVDEKPLLVPNCVYGDPEVASIGLTEAEALKTERKVKVAEFPFMANGRAGTLGREEGSIIIVADSETEEVLGFHMLGPRVTELVSLATLAMQNGIDVTGIKKTVFPHPTLSETFHEAALASDDEAIHMQVRSDRLEGAEIPGS